MAASKLRGAFDKALEETLRECSLRRISACFPALRDEPELLKVAHEQIQTLFRQNCTAEFEVILEETKMSERLAALDDFLRQARVSANNAAATTDHKSMNGPNASPPLPQPQYPLPAEIVARAHVHLAKKERLRLLKERLSEVVKDNEAAKSNLAALESRYQDLLNTIEAGFAPLKAVEATILEWPDRISVHEAIDAVLPA